MTKNEIIAAKFWDRIKSTDEAEDGDLARFQGATGIVIVTMNEYEDGQFTRSYVTWNPSEYIEDWHGKHGLLQKIEERGLASNFFHNLMRVSRQPVTGHPGFEMLRMAGDPAQLTDALVATIEEVEK